jgi:hypothetical protein
MDTVKVKEKMRQMEPERRKAVKKETVDSIAFRGARQEGRAHSRNYYAEMLIRSFSRSFSRFFTI